jgi:hypothetical protein
MKAYKIALGLFILNVAIQYLGAVNLFYSGWDTAKTSNYSNLTGTNFTYTYDPINGTWYMAYDQNLTNNTPMLASMDQPSGLGEGDILGAMSTFFTALKNATVFLPFWLKSLGFPDIAVTFITAPVWFTYGAGVFQVVTGRGFKANE